MFTGIVEEAGTVERIAPGAEAIELTVRSALSALGLKVGDSLAVNGCCLTAVRVRPGKGGGRLVRFDVLEESWRRTNLQFARPGSLVNLERPLRANGRLDGHFVTGHVDGLGKITRWEQAGRDYVLDVACPPDVMRCVVFKGSIAIDGISLTVARVLKRGVRIWIIPHTREITALRERQAGDAVNLEADILAKYVGRFLNHPSQR